MSERNETTEPAEHEHPADVLTGEDVVLEEMPFVDDLTGPIEDSPIEDPVAEEAPAPLDQPTTPEADPAGAAETSAEEDAREEDAREEAPREDAPAEEVAAVEEVAAEAPPVEPAQAPEPEEDSPINTASADDLTDSISSLDADFFTPLTGDADSPMRDVLQGRATQAIVGDDGQSLVTVERPEDTLSEASADETVDTTIMRRSLINQQAPESTPRDSQATEAFPSVPATDTMFAPVAQGTQVTPVAAAPAMAGFPEPRGDSGLLEGATILPTVPSRAGARWLSAIATILLVPLAWYLLTDSAVRLVLAVDNPWSTGNVNLAALGEMAGGLAILLLIAVLAMQSSLGLFLAGIDLIVVGIPFLVVPGLVSSLLESYVSGPLSRLGAFGQNVYFHLTITGASGILLMAGFALVLGGWVAFKLRRTGRGEEALRAEVAAINPEGIRARWARKATERAARR